MSKNNANRHDEIPESIRMLLERRGGQDRRSQHLALGKLDRRTGKDRRQQRPTEVPRIEVTVDDESAGSRKKPQAS